MIDPAWRRIAGIHAMNDGEIGAVWLAHDTIADVTHLYDAALFKREVLAVVGEGISARGRWIPLAWHKDAKEFADKLLERGINVLPEPCSGNQSMAEVISREIWQRMRTSRFRVAAGVAEWLEEFRTFYRDGAKVPLDSHPLMAATRHAIEMLAYARPEQMPGSKRPNHPKIRVI
jgi:hypothetical protein